MIVENTPIIDPFHNSLHKAIEEEIYKRSILIVSGGAKNYEDYREKVGYITGLNDALKHCQYIEETMYGVKPGEK